LVPSLLLLLSPFSCCLWSVPACVLGNGANTTRPARPPVCGLLAPSPLPPFPREIILLSHQKTSTVTWSASPVLNIHSRDPSGSPLRVVCLRAVAPFPVVANRRIQWHSFFRPIPRAVGKRRRFPSLTLSVHTVHPVYPSALPSLLPSDHLSHSHPHSQPLLQLTESFCFTCNQTPHILSPFLSMMNKSTRPLCVPYRIVGASSHGFVPSYRRERIAPLHPTCSPGSVSCTTARFVSSPTDSSHPSFPH